MELVQGFLPLPQEGAGTMLQLLEPLQEKLGSCHPFWQPMPTLQVQEGSSQGQSPCRMPESLPARLVPPQPAPAQGLMIPLPAPARAEVWWGSVISVGTATPGSLRSYKPCLLLLPAPRTPALPASVGTLQGPSDLQTNNPSLRTAI